MPPDKLKRLIELEATGLFGEGEAWDYGRYPEEYAKLALGPYPFLYGARPDPIYDPLGQLTGISWELYRTM